MPHIPTPTPKSMAMVAVLAPAMFCTLLTGCATLSGPSHTVLSSGPSAMGTPASGGSAAVAQLFTPEGQPAGRADLAQAAGGTEIIVHVRSLAPGAHGFHVHANSACAPGPDAATGQVVPFGAAGGHFDPGHSRNHGSPGQAPHEAHAGELPNIPVQADGTGTLRYVNPHVTLTPGKTSVLGRTIVVHENADDYESDPAGNSGGRLLCGLIEPTARGAVAGRTIIEGANAFPEGIAVDARDGSVYVGSSSEGHIWRITPAAQQAQMLQAGGAAGRQAAYGMKVDGAGRLWVAGGAQGSVAVVDLSTASTLAVLKGPSGSQTFLNDLVLAADGYAYVTDSLRPVLLRARHAGGTPGPLELWLDLSATPMRHHPNELNQRYCVLARRTLVAGRPTRHRPAMAHRHDHTCSDRSSRGRRPTWRPAQRGRHGAAGAGFVRAAQRRQRDCSPGAGRWMGQCPRYTAHHGPAPALSHHGSSRERRVDGGERPAQQAQGAATAVAF
jgi:Cu-Zn family superoxide dismutase